MTIARLKEKNQVTLPKKIVERLNLKKDDFFEVRVEKTILSLFLLSLSLNILLKS